ncbi:MAG: type II secretion system F family protein [Caulobacteraceae bacterium]
MGAVPRTRPGVAGRRHSWLHHTRSQIGKQHKVPVLGNIWTTALSPNPPNTPPGHSPAARSFATMLRQAEEMGTSLGDTLTVFSEDMRARRMLKAEEKALALPTKLVVPLILFIFPCLLGVLMLPAMVKIAAEMAK